MTSTGRNPLVRRDVVIPPADLPGFLSIPEEARGLVLFAHGSGSSRLSPRNNYVAEYLQQAAIGTLLFDLLSEAEGRDRAKVFDIELLAERLAGATEWAAGQTDVGDLPFGYFGASTGSAAALIAAADGPTRVAAIVSRGGRPDLAAAFLPRVRCPTLLIVGGHDTQVLELNRQALAMLSCKKRCDVVPGATHLFEEPGALDQVVDLARSWFLAHFPAATQAG